MADNTRNRPGKKPHKKSFRMNPPHFGPDGDTSPDDIDLYLDEDETDPALKGEKRE